MSKAPRIARPAVVAPQTFPMSPQEARDLSALLAQRSATEAGIQNVVNQASARLGLAIGSKIAFDLKDCVFRIGG